MSAMRLSMYGPAKTNCLRFVCTLRPGVRASSRRGAESPRTEGSDCYARDAVMLGMPLCSAYSAPFHGPARAQRRRELSHCAARRRKAPPRCLPAICAAGRTEGAGSGERPAPAVHRRRRLPAGDSVPALRSRLYASDGSVLRYSVPAVRSPATLCRLYALDGFLRSREQGAFRAGDAGGPPSLPPAASPSVCIGGVM